MPPALNDYKWIRAFTAYDEWQNSKFSQRNPLTFYTADFTTCQGCHMKRAANVLPEPGAKNGTFVSHRWPAGNSAVPFYYGFDEQLQKADTLARYQRLPHRVEHRQRLGSHARIDYRRGDGG